MGSREAGCRCGLLRFEVAGDLRQAIDLWEGFREMAKQDHDFDPIRAEPALRELVGSSQ